MHVNKREGKTVMCIQGSQVENEHPLIEIPVKVTLDKGALLIMTVVGEVDNKEDGVICATTLDHASQDGQGIREDRADEEGVHCAIYSLM